MSYTELKQKQPELHECFFAFSKQQFDEGIKKTGIEGKKIFRGIGGLYGTEEGIKKLYSYYDEMSKQISETCSPQEVYNYEFVNHECEYVCGDTEAMKITASYFDTEKLKTIKRRYARLTVEEIEAIIINEMKEK